MIAYFAGKCNMKRYRITCSDCDPYLDQSMDGDWVRYSDVVKMIQEKDLQALKASAEADKYRIALQDARAVIQKAVDATQGLAPFVLAHRKWGSE